MTERRRRYRVSLSTAVDWIAYNDEDSEMDPEVIAQSISVCLVADAWKINAMDIAKAIVKRRQRRHP